MVFFFYGPNTYASRQQVNSMVETYIKKTGSNFGLERVEGASANINNLRAALQAIPFLATSRLVIVEKLGANKAAADKVGELVRSVPESTVAVFYETEVDKRTNYFKTLSEQAETVLFEQLSSTQLEAWAKKEIGRLGGSIEPRALRRLVELVGDDQWRLAQEVNKLVNYRPHIEQEQVDGLVQAGFTENIFDLVDAMTSGRAKTALEIYRGLLVERTSEIYVLTMIIWQLRNLLLAKTAGSIPPPELAKRAGMSPYVATKALSKQRQFSEEALKAAFTRAVDCEYRIKSGQIPGELAVEQLIFGIATQGN